MSDNEKNFSQLDEEAASAIMANVFAACNQTPSTVPLDVLSSYTEYRRDRFTMQKSILIFVLVIFLLLPICFIAPRFQVEQIEMSQTGVPTYEVLVSGFIPVRLVSAKVDGHSIAVYESMARVFTVVPKNNGRLTITVTLANRQFDFWSAEITTVDSRAPQLLGSQAVGNQIRIFVEDEGIGVDYSSAYGITEDGQRVLPVSFSEEEGYLDFPGQAGIDIYIPDKNGNLLQLVLSVREQAE